MPIFIQTYTDSSPNVFNTILRHGSEIWDHFHIGLLEHQRLFYPMTDLVFRDELLNDLIEIDNLQFERIQNITEYSVDPMNYPKKFEKFVTSDYIEELVWKKSKSTKSSHSYYKIFKYWPDRTDSNLTTHVIHRQYIGHEKWSFEIKWDPASLEKSPVVWSSDGIIISNELYQKLSKEFDPPHWLLYDMDREKQILPIVD